MRSFGRLVHKDERDSEYRVAKLLAKSAGDIPKSRYWKANVWFGNQRNVPHCVAFSWLHWLADGPIYHRGKKHPLVKPIKLYRMAQNLDDISGKNYAGTTVRGGAKALRKLGYVASFHWGTTLHDLKETVLTLGPVVVGTNWYENMNNTDSNGLIRATGSLEGGHAYVVNGCDTKKKLFRIKNSWGRRWGKGGSANISFADMKKLIEEDGEICLAIEVVKGAK